MRKILLIFIFCAIANAIPLENRIVGGQTARLGQFPFTASLRNPFNQHICGGVVISSRFGMSAAHCTWGRRAADVFIVAGTVRRTTGGTSYPVSEILYNRYNQWTRENDICLLRTGAQIFFTDFIRAIPLNFDHIPGGATGLVSGWGSISSIGGRPGPAPDEMQWLSKRTITNQQCAQVLDPSMQNFFPIIDSFLCTQGIVGQGFCFGDSGGPLQHSDGSLIGIVSWAIPCALGHPDVYIRISPYKEWITSVI